MTPDEFELAKEATKELVKQTLAPVQEIVRELSGPAATEVGLMLGDFFRVWRLKRVVRYLEDVQQIASDAGLRLRPVAPRLLFPILDAATLEDDVELHRRWVALLTNAARTDFESDILPSFPDILKQLTPAEAQFLDEIHDEINQDEMESAAKSLNENPNLAQSPFMKRPVRGPKLKSVHPIVIESLERLMLVTRTGGIDFTSDDRQLVNTFAPANHLYMTGLGKAFVRACRLPATSR